MVSEYLELLLFGVVNWPQWSASFPATYLETKLEWDALVLNAKTMERIKNLENWMKYNSVLLNNWQMKKNRLAPGYRFVLWPSGYRKKPLLPAFWANIPEERYIKLIFPWWYPNTSERQKKPGQPF